MSLRKFLKNAVENQSYLVSDIRYAGRSANLARGYAMVHLRILDSKRKWHQVHNLVPWKIILDESNSIQVTKKNKIHIILGLDPTTLQNLKKAIKPKSRVVVDERPDHSLLDE